jgi:non-ribosomal peptide synthetase component F
LDLPTDRLRLTDEILDGARQYARLPASLTAALESVSRAEGATLFMTLLAAFQTLLFRYTVQKDIVVGIPVAGRSRVEVEPLIGCFVNTLVICTNFSGNPSFRELLGDVRETTLEAFSHQELPFEKLVQELEPSRNFRQSPLFRVMFALQHRPEQPLVMSGLTVIPVELPAKTAMFDLGLWITLQGKTLTVGIEYKTGLFDEELIARMLSHFQTLLEAIAADPSCAVSRLPMLTQQEQHQVLIGWNQTTVDCSSFFS